MRHIIKAKTLDTANTTITNDMTVGEAREIKKAQAQAINQYKKAALAQILTEEGRDLEAELLNWTNLKYDITHTRNGNVQIHQYDYDEYQGDTLRKTWKISKKTLIKKYMKETL